MNPSNKNFYTIISIVCIFILIFTQVEYSVIGPSIAQGFNETSSVKQSGEIPQSDQQDWMGSSQRIEQDSRDNARKSAQPSWMNTSENTKYETTSLQLWVQGSAGKSQYQMYPIGNTFQLLANAPANGVAELYDLSLQSGTVKSKKYRLIAGYNTISLSPDQSGRHILLFTMNDRPSNAVIIDVTDFVNQMESNAGGIPAATPMD